MTTTLDVLCDAYGLLHERGWCKFAGMNEDGCMCMSGALRVAAGLDVIHEAGWQAPNGNVYVHPVVWQNPSEPEGANRRYIDAMEVLGAAANVGPEAGYRRNVVEHNDHPEMTDDRALAWLERGIAFVAKREWLTGIYGP